MRLVKTAGRRIGMGSGHGPPSSVREPRLLASRYRRPSGERARLPRCRRCRRPMVRDGATVSSVNAILDHGRGIAGSIGGTQMEDMGLSAVPSRATGGQAELPEASTSTVAKAPCPACTSSDRTPERLSNTRPFQHDIRRVTVGIQPLDYDSRWATHDRDRKRIEDVSSQLRPVARPS